MKKIVLTKSHLRIKLFIGFTLIVFGCTDLKAQIINETFESAACSCCSSYKQL
jgi:hypothetical protein